MATECFFQMRSSRRVQNSGRCYVAHVYKQQMNRLQICDFKERGRHPHTVLLHTMRSRPQGMAICVAVQPAQSRLKKQTPPRPKGRTVTAQAARSDAAWKVALFIFLFSKAEGCKAIAPTGAPLHPCRRARLKNRLHRCRVLRFRTSRSCRLPHRPRPGHSTRSWGNR